MKGRDSQKGGDLLAVREVHVTQQDAADSAEGLK